MDVYRAKRNVPLAEGIWRQGTDRVIDPAKFSTQIERGQIVRVGAGMVEEARPALDPDAEELVPLPPDVDEDVDFAAPADTDQPDEQDDSDPDDSPVDPGPFAAPRAPY